MKLLTVAIKEAMPRKQDYVEWMIVPCPPPNSYGRIKHVREQCIALAPVFQPLFCQVVAEEVVLVANLLED